MSVNLIHVESVGKPLAAFTQALEGRSDIAELKERVRQFAKRFVVPGLNRFA